MKIILDFHNLALVLLKDLSSPRSPNLDARIVAVHAIVTIIVAVMVGKESAKSHVSVCITSSNDVPKTIVLNDLIL